MLRRARLTQDQIARQLAMPTSTVTIVCKRLGLSRLSALDPVEPANRYERRRPGELLHIDIKTTRTNGKAERFIQTLLRGWAYGAIYNTSHQRRRALPGWVNDDNTVRPHASLATRPPATRLAELLEEQRLYD